MQRLEVEQIFDETKEILLEGLVRCEMPLAVILGGQPASGKSQLTLIAQENHPDVDFLIVNGDLFREYHPQYKTLIEDPLTFSEIGCFNRYQKEVAAIGVGRLADINSHNEAVKGVPYSVDALFRNQAVDKIAIYSFGARELIRNYNFNGKWDSDLSPTDFIEQARENQLNDKNLHAEIIRMGEQTLNNMAEEFKNTISHTLEKLKDRKGRD